MTTSYSTRNKCVFLSLCLSLSFSLAQAQNFHKWVDANGSTHYTTTPPPKNAKKLGSVNTFDDTPSGSQYQAATATQSNTASNSTPQAQQAERDAQNARDEAEKAKKNAEGVYNPNAERVPLPPQKPDPTANQPITIGQGSTSL